MHASGLTDATDFFYLALIPLFPFIGALINGLFGSRIQRKFGPRMASNLAIAMPTLSFVVTMVALFKLIGLPEEARALHANLFPFIHIGFFDADMAFWFDPLSAVLTCIITFIGTLIHIYSVGYMHGDEGYWRFFAYLNLFMGSMLMLVLGDNFLIMFIGWEGVGLCSYLLISFWYRDINNATAGMKAFVTNRVGDFGFVIGLAFLFWGMMGNYGSADEAGYETGKWNNLPVATAEKMQLEEQSRVGFKPVGMGERTRIPPASVRFDAVKARINADKNLWQEGSSAAKTFMGVPLIVLVCLFFFLGAAGKSAQIPLYTWLPDAMAGPTPVSALIHAATMVTAGVYMVARLSFLYSLSATAMTVVTLVGALTALFAATIGLFQYDIKKVLAYSTVSQLGYMFVGVGVGAYWAGCYHLLTHAIFKACLFLGSGSVILGCHHEQDMRKMGGLKKYMPLTEKTYLAACMAITTAPVFFIANGFYSKDEILWKAFDANHLLIPGWVIWLIGFIGAGMTSFYMWRSYYMTFTGEYRGNTDGHHDGHHDDHADDHGHHGGLPHESPRSMTWVLVTLAILIPLSIIIGWSPLFGSLFHIEAWKEPIFEQWLHPVVGQAMESLNWWSKDPASNQGDVHFWEYLLAAASILWTLATWWLARMLYKDATSQVPFRLRMHPSPLLRVPYRLIYNKYYIDELYDHWFITPAKRLGRFLYGIDQKIFDGIIHSVAALGRFIGEVDGAIDRIVVDGAVNGVANVTGAIGSKLRQTQTGNIQTYLAGAIVGAITLVFINFVLF